MHIIQPPLFDFEAFITSRGNHRLVVILGALDVEKLIVTLERERLIERYFKELEDNDILRWTLKFRQLAKRESRS